MRTSRVTLVIGFLGNLLAAGCGSEETTVSAAAAGLPADAGTSADLQTTSSDAGSAARPDARGLVAVGAACSLHTDCASELCVSKTCEQRCDIERPNDCSRVGGFCVPTTLPDVFFCRGDVKVGFDDDNAILQVGDSVTRHLSPLNDADIFLVRLNRLGGIVVAAIPAAGVDVALDVYDPLGDKVGAFNGYKNGGAEGAQTGAMTTTGYIYVVVRNAGNSTGAYQLRVFAQ